MKARYLSAQVKPEFFTQVKIEMAKRSLTMREVVVLGVATLLGLDPTSELDLSHFKELERQLEQAECGKEATNG